MRTGIFGQVGIWAILTTAVFVSSAHAAPLNVEARVDTEVCASGAVQCTVAGTGHSAAEASSANHNPIRMFVQVVSKSGVPVEGLTAANFEFENPFVPAGGGAAGLCDEDTCTEDTFQGGGNGLYSLFLDRSAAGNWKAGAYAGTVTVTQGGNRGAAIVTFDIP